MKNSVTMIIGQRGSGKSVLLKREIFSRSKVLSFDINGEQTYMTQFYSIEALANAIENEESFHYAYVPDIAENEIGKFCRLAMAKGNLTVALDEAHTIAPLTASLDKDFVRLVTRGRHRGVSIIFASQRLALVSKLLTSQANTCIFFKLTEPRDVSAASEWLGNDCEKLKSLATGEHMKRGF